ncbi:hypothetical protein HQ531_05220 [bacterium]|nr:hypothetical protein [bacterium]
MLRIKSLLVSIVILTFAVPALSEVRNAGTQAPIPMTASKALDWEIGMELASHRDDLIVPLGFHGPGIALGLSYRRNSEKWKLLLPARFKFDFVLNRFSHPGRTFSVDFNPTFLKPLILDEKLGLVHIGLAFPFKINNYFPFSWDDAHLYWFTINSTALVLEWGPPGRTAKPLSFHLELPFISRISRPPVYRHDKQDEGLAWLGFKSTKAKRQYELETFSAYQGILFRTDYSRNPLSNWSIEFEFDHYSKPEPVWAINTSIHYVRELRGWK